MVPKSMNKIFAYQMPTRIVYGPGSLKELPRELKAAGVSKVWVVTDPGVQAAGLLDKVAGVLAEAGMGWGYFADVHRVATVQAARESYHRAREFGADGVVALAGGSGLVIGKATGLLLGLGGDPYDWEDRSSIKRDAAPVVAIPTVAGSGAEVSQFMPLVDEERKVKLTVGNHYTFPRVAILDPELLLTVPIHQATYSGIDALTHAIESYVTDLSTPVTDAMALAAMRILMQNLRPAIKTNDINAKYQCLMASALANMACGNAKLGLVHGLARNVQSLFEIPYGLTIGVFLPSVMEFNARAVPARFRDMAVAFGEPVDGLSDREAANKAVDCVKKLLVDLNFPRSFNPAVVDKHKIPLMAKMAIAGQYEKKRSLEELENMPEAGYAISPNICRASYREIVELYELSMTGWQLPGED